MKSLQFNVIIAFCLMMGVLACATASQNSTKVPVTSSSGDNRAANSIIWTELLQKTPFPHTAPLPPQRPTVLDGFYTKFDPKETPPAPCRRCPDYVPEGGIWKLNLDKGIFRIFHEFSGWRSIGSFVVDGDRVQLFNDPTCMETAGTYTWVLDGGILSLQVNQDDYAIRMRAKNLTQLPWTSCQPLSTEGGTRGQWKNPPGCD